MVISQADAAQAVIQKRIEKHHVDHLSYTFLVLSDSSGLARACEIAEHLDEVIGGDSKCIVYKNFNDNPVAMMVSYKRYMELLGIENAYAELQQARP